VVHAGGLFALGTCARGGYDYNRATTECLVTDGLIGGNEMNLSRELVLPLGVIVVILTVSVGCVAQDTPRAPSGPVASDLFAYSGVAPDSPTRTLEPEYGQSPLLYFPVGIFERNPQLSTYKENWYSQFLFAMGEPSLLAVAKTADTTSYRLLLVLSHRALSFRLALYANGTGNLTTKDVLIRSDGKSSLRVKHSIPVSKSQVLEFLALLHGIHFWSVQPEQSGEDNRYQMDNAEWVLEGVSGQRYHVVDRWAPRDPGFIQAGAFLMQLAHPGR
jgi:hypothetical protein